YQFGVTLSAAVMLSLVEALTITPMRCSQFLRAGHNDSFMDRVMSAMSRIYGKMLSWVLDHRWLTLAVALGVFALVFPLSKAVKKEFVPSQDQSRFLTRIQTPTGSSLPFTDGVFKLAEKKIMENPAVLNYFSAVGGFGGGETDAGNLFIT